MTNHLVISFLAFCVLQPATPNANLAEMNRVRANLSLPALTWSDSLAEIAQRHADVVARDRRGRLWHPGGGTEIAALGQESIQEACESWMRSRGHRAILIGAYTRVGIAQATNRQGQIVWMVQFE